MLELELELVFRDMIRLSAVDYSIHWREICREIMIRGVGIKKRSRSK
jgi:hypothetical protein